jgi:hypothetical protein
MPAGRGGRDDGIDAEGESRRLEDLLARAQVSWAGRMPGVLEEPAPDREDRAHAQAWLRRGGRAASPPWISSAGRP